MLLLVASVVDLTSGCCGCALKSHAIIFLGRQIWHLSYNLVTPSWPSQCIMKGFYLRMELQEDSPVFIDYAHIKFTSHYHDSFLSSIGSKLTSSVTYVDVQ